jgi:hypothetical protein
MASGRTVCRRDDERPRVFGVETVWYNVCARVDGRRRVTYVGRHSQATTVPCWRRAKHELEFGMRSAHGNEPAVSVAAKAW